MRRVAHQRAVRIVLVGGAMIALSALSISALSPLGFMSSDTGLRFLQIQELIAHRWSTFAIDYPARFVDPELRHVPYYYAYSVIDDRIYLQVTPFFPLLASFCFFLLGAPGLAIIPVLGAVLTGWGIHRLIRLSGLRHADLGFGVAIFATPLLFYSTQLWDHTLGAAFAVWAVYGIARGVEQRAWLPLLLGGVAMGLGLGQRPELYAFAVALGTALVIQTWPSWRPALVAAAGGAIGVLPVWILHQLWYGHPLGVVVGNGLLGYGEPAVPFRSMLGIEMSFWLQRACFLIPSFPVRFESTVAAPLLIVSGMATMVACLRSQRLRDPRLLWGGFLVATAGYVLIALSARQLLVTGILATFPLLPLSLAQRGRAPGAGADSRAYPIVAWTVSLFVALMVFVWPACGGLQWGARYLLPAYPLLVYLAVAGYSSQQRIPSGTSSALRFVGIGLVVVALGLQVLSVRLALVGADRRAAMRDSIATVPAEVILTSDEYLAAMMASLRDKAFLFVADDQEVIQVLPDLVQENVRRVALMPSRWAPLTMPDELPGVRVRRVTRYVYELSPR